MGAQDTLLMPLSGLTGSVLVFCGLTGAICKNKHFVTVLSVAILLSGFQFLCVHGVYSQIQSHIECMTDCNYGILVNNH